jgi:hypothetical protein
MHELTGAAALGHTTVSGVCRDIDREKEHEGQGAAPALARVREHALAIGELHTPLVSTNGMRSLVFHHRDEGSLPLGIRRIVRKAALGHRGPPASGRRWRPR